MPRTPRILLAGIPFHATHRGNQRRRVFFNDRDYREYLGLLAKYAQMFAMSVWAYCLMPNHVHLLVVGARPESISRAVGNAQRVFARRRHLDADVTGHFWGARHYASPLDEAHAWAAVRYIERNPVRAGLVSRAADYPWSSARAHAGLTQEALLDPGRPFPGPIQDWVRWLEIEVESSVASALRCNTLLGRPTGSDEFVEDLERRAGRPLRPRKRGPAPRAELRSTHRNPG